MNNLIPLLFFSLLPVELPTTEYHEIIEVNRVFSNDGNVVLNQVIWRDYNRGTNTFDIVGWRLLPQPSLTKEEEKEKKDFENVNKGWVWNPPLKYHEIMGGNSKRPLYKWRSTFYDRKGDQIRVIYAKWRIFSSYPFDVEMEERGDLPQERRRGLKK